MESQNLDNRWEIVKAEGDKIFNEANIRKKRYLNGELKRHEVLHFLRGNLEARHREATTSNARLYTFCVSTTNLDLTEREFNQNGPSVHRNAAERSRDLCNTSIPVYLLATPNKGGGGLIGTLRLALSNFIYRKWFQPYKTEIEFDRSLVQFIRPIDIQCITTRPPVSVFDTLTYLNKDICNHIEKTKNDAVRKIREYLEVTSDIQMAGTQGDKDERDRWAKIIREEFSDEAESLQQCYCIQHLFRAIFLVVCGHNYMGEGSGAIGKMPVFIAVTGEQEGLSAPITFDSIRDKIDAVINPGPRMVVQTTLETAAEFLVNLERREIAALGLCPNPPAEVRSRVLRHANPNDREYSRVFEELGSSSQWVDTNIYTEWIGGGKDQDVYYAEGQEEFQRVSCAPWMRRWGAGAGN